MTENTINPITELEINGEEVEAKATYLIKRLRNSQRRAR